MYLKNVMWDMFKDTGRIEAYLFYRNCEEELQTQEYQDQIKVEDVSKQFEH